MAKKKYGFEKRQRELNKEQKREEKRQRKLDRKTSEGAGEDVERASDGGPAVEPEN
ncbi:MAG TPA: hypothetical protein VH764_15085 [Gemmatimonadales bacterium]